MRTRRSRVLFVAFAVVVAIAGLVVFGFVELAYGLNDTGPEEYPWSPLYRYHHPHGAVGILVPVGYALVPAALALLAGAVADDRRVRVGLGGLAVAATLLPAIVPSLLDRSIRGTDPALLSERYTSHSVPGGVRVCMKYAVEGEERAGKPPVLCVVVGGRQADEILDDSNGEISAEDVASDLNSQGITPREQPKTIGVDGLKLVSARWS
jgi:hypothetical protein